MLFLNLFTLLLGGFLTYKIIDNQDFCNESLLFKWVNYIFASVGGLCVTIPLFNIITLGAMIGTFTSVIALLASLIVLYVYWKCEFSARIASKKLSALWKDIKISFLLFTHKHFR